MKSRIEPVFFTKTGLFFLPAIPLYARADFGAGKIARGRGNRIVFGKHSVLLLRLSRNRIGGGCFLYLCLCLRCAAG